MDIQTQLLLIIIFVQIFVESFPFSSSGHVKLVIEIFCKIKNVNFTKDLIPGFLDPLLHGPTVLILMFVFYKSWFNPVKKLLQGIVDKDFRKKDSYKNLCKIFYKLCCYVFVTSIFAVIAWIIVKIFLSKTVWFNSSATLLLGFCVTTVLLFLLVILRCASLTQDERGGGVNLQKKILQRSVRTRLYAIVIRRRKRSIVDAKSNVLNIKKVLIISLAQSIALVPGISRFAAVYVTTRLLRVNTRRAFEFTFLIQFPLIVAGFLLGVYEVVKINMFNFFSLPIIFTIFISTILSFFAFKWIKSLALKNKLGYLFVYMLVPIVVFLCFVL